MCSLSNRMHAWHACASRNILIIYNILTTMYVDYVDSSPRNLPRIFLNTWGLLCSRSKVKWANCDAAVLGDVYVGDGGGGHLVGEDD